MKTADELTQRYSVVAQEAAIAENAACVAQVRAYGCLCWILEHGDEGFTGHIEEIIDPEEEAVGRELFAHDHRCPQSIADAIEARIKA